MIGDLHEQDLRHGHSRTWKNIARARRRLLDQAVEQRADLAVAAKRRRDDGARQPTVAVGKRGKALVGVEEGVERPVAVEDAGEQAGGGGAGGGARGRRGPGRWSICGIGSMRLARHRPGGNKP